MLSSVLRSKRAVQVDVGIMRAFVNLRRLATSYPGLARRLDELESKYDIQFQEVFAAIRGLMACPAESKRRIGFNPQANVRVSGSDYRSPPTGGRRPPYPMLDASHCESCHEVSFPPSKYR